ncbi:hypothetical protein E3N88_40132 [Mikania micrantha]|uniref:SCP domain-containing protein n=1 Tax=Mikania micrantha TaxID=192012 RepID=A0A5N6LLW1_9ASTR|nr:hypothetical protein E3N88_40132 [Mikania micrantha]
MRHRCTISLVLALFILVLHLSNAQDGDKGSKPEDYVCQHNCIRRVLNLPPLKWDAEVEKRAIAWAEKRKVDCELIHSEGGGENLAKGYITGMQAVQMWVDERPDYDYAKNECTAMCGHYTQVVWKNTTKVGCARRKCNNNEDWIVVCNYAPPGNYIGQYPY